MTLEHNESRKTMSKPAYRIADILREKADQYELTIFHPDAVAWLEEQLFEKRGHPYLKCLASDRDRRAYPEEIVRQLYVKKLMDDYGYPKERIQVEKPVFFGSGMGKKRADIVVMHADDPEAAYIIVEVKKPNREDGIEQLKSYCNAEGSPIAVWTNGGEVVVMHRVEPNLYRALTDIPNVHQTLEAISAERVTLAQLTERDKLITERLSLKDVILDLENLVLANAGVDAFEEVFKLIYAKLYDEWRAARPGGQHLQFRVLDEDYQAFYNRINGLFNAAKDQWPGVFFPGEKIDLTPGHLATCVSFLQDIKLFNSNLQVIDEAFEYLMTEVGKGKKGQYFTPRHVIDMAVKMLNPTFDEYVIDPAAGSCGFTVHAVFWVWGEQLNAQGPNQWQREYASTHVYGLDFDARAVKIARAINLIAGDGRTNVYRANTLAPYLWDDTVRVGLRDRLHPFPEDPERDRWNQEHYRYFNFDVLMTNPPFAGDIRESKILHQYELAKRGRDRVATKQGRDILFIERNLEFLRPGGRMAMVLPQGRFNNTTDAYIREFIARECRILAVVGLDVNTFKPHTGTKTSLLFVQKWNDDPEAGPLCPHVDDYPIFFATSKESGKDTSGEYDYKTDEHDQRLLDEHGHLIVDHDLDEIATAFVLFAKEQGFSFWKDDERPF
jgi:type I restriction enzyme M protein